MPTVEAGSAAADHILNHDPNRREQEETKTQGFHSSFLGQEVNFKKLKETQSLKNLGVLACGTILPAILTAAYATACFERITRLIIKHPVETLLESALIAAVPIVNYVIWRAVTNQDGRFGMRRGILNGLSIGTSAVVATVCGAALYLGYPVESPADQTSYEGAFQFLMGASLISCITSIYLGNEMRRMWEFRSSRVRSVVYSIIGSLLSLAAFAGSEARPTLVRIAEQDALSHNRAQHEKGLQALRDLNAERDLIMEGADPRCAGLPGLFLRIDPQYMKPLYFAVTGKPYRAENEVNWSVLSDDYLKRHLVGAKEEGLSLLRSSMYSEIHPKTLSGTTSWTFVFSNDEYQSKEVRAEIGLPPGAVVSGLSTWLDGKKRDASFTATGGVATDNEITADHDQPAIITDLGRSRVLLHCYPVNGHSELKVQLNMVTPLKNNGLQSAQLTLPRIIESNFDIEGDHRLQMSATDNSVLTMVAGKDHTSNTSSKTISRTLDNDELSKAGLFVDVSLPQDFQPVVAQNPFAKRWSNAWKNIVESIYQVTAKAPDRLVVVLDGSVAVQKHYKEVADALSKLPASVSASLILAKDDGHVRSVSLADGLKELKAGSFAGGRDNLEAVVRGAEIAGESKNGAVLWVHGPQPGYSKEIYITSPFAAKPKFFELPLDNGETDTREFLKNHEEIGPVVSVPRSGNIGYDIAHFLDRWSSGDSETKVAYSLGKKQDAHYDATKDEAREVAILWANNRVQELINQNKLRDAAYLAIEHGILSPVSLAAVLTPVQNQQSQSDQTAASSSSFGSGESPMLQGATNGTIGPESGDATVVSGINTAGTIRVNNLANLEAMLNIFANTAELLGMLFGAMLIFNSVAARAGESKLLGIFLPQQRGLRFALGAAILFVGLSVPGFINYMVASARDANLFS
jgi:hypothetical protein